MFNNISAGFVRLFSEAVSENSISEDSVSDNVVAQVQTVIAEEIGVDNIDEKVSVIQNYLKEWPDKILRFGIRAGLAILIFIIGCKLISVIRKLLKKSMTKHNFDAGVISFLDSFVKVVLFILLFWGLASYFGIQTTGLVTLFGSAGVAIALAFQGSLSNLIGGLLILILKPFRVGDYIIEHTKDKEGTVIDIKLFHTRLRTTDDKIILLPNGALANSSLTNLNMTPIRRVCLKCGIAYDADIKLAKETISKVITDCEYTLKDSNVDIYVDELADSAVVIGFRFYVKNEDYWKARWETLENVKLSLDKAGVEIPFNQMDVHIKND